MGAMWLSAEFSAATLIMIKARPRLVAKVAPCEPAVLENGEGDEI